MYAESLRRRLKLRFSACNPCHAMAKRLLPLLGLAACLATACEPARPVSVQQALGAIEQGKLTASDKAANDLFGESVAVSGDTVVIGAHEADPSGLTDAGAVYVFVRSGTSWTEQVKLTASDKAAGDYFGFGVALSGDTLVVGAPEATVSGIAQAGAAYVFVRSGTSWTEQAKLTASDKAGGGFGVVAVDGDTAVVGAPGAASAGIIGAGEVYVFVRSGTSWTEQAKLTASRKAFNDALGNSVAISGDLIVAGAIYSGTGAGQPGAAYVFGRTGTSWTEQAKLEAIDAKGFGCSVSISADTAIVGSLWSSPGGLSDAGAAYVFKQFGTFWIQQAALTASDKAKENAFGFSVSIAGNIAVVGASYATVGGKLNSGAAYVFLRQGTVWSEQIKMSASDKMAGDGFGKAVSLSADTAVVGAGGNPEGVFKAGMAYVLLVPKVLGDPCTVSSECFSGFCTDGVCCNSACGGGMTADCQACSTATGAAVSGTCGMVQLTANHICRPSNRVCDKPEICDGMSTACPSDELYQPADMHLCRAATFCSRDIYCDGSIASCPLSLCLPPHFP